VDDTGIEPAQHHERIPSSESGAVPAGERVAEVGFISEGARLDAGCALGVGTFAVFKRCGMVGVGQRQEVPSPPVSAAASPCGTGGGGSLDTGSRLFDRRCFGVGPLGAPSAQREERLSHDTERMEGT
jgi:hypothetical protein